MKNRLQLTRLLSWPVLTAALVLGTALAPASATGAEDTKARAPKIQKETSEPSAEVKPAPIADDSPINPSKRPAQTSPRKKQPVKSQPDDPARKPRVKTP